MEQRRHFQRVHFVQSVIVESAEGTHATHCLDISLRGLLIARPAQTAWQTKQPLQITLLLSPEESIRMSCTLAHLDEDVAGCTCDLLDIDSMTSLRRLLELNLANPEEMQRELSELLRIEA